MNLETRSAFRCLAARHSPLLRQYTPRMTGQDAFKDEFTHSHGGQCYFVAVDPSFPLQVSLCDSRQELTLVCVHTHSLAVCRSDALLSCGTSQVKETDLAPNRRSPTLRASSLKSRFKVTTRNGPPMSTRSLNAPTTLSPLPLSLLTRTTLTTTTRTRRPARVSRHRKTRPTRSRRNVNSSATSSRNSLKRAEARSRTSQTVN